MAQCFVDKLWHELIKYFAASHLQIGYRKNWGFGNYDDHEYNEKDEL